MNQSQEAKAPLRLLFYHKKTLVARRRERNMICVKCGQEVPEGQYCARCGAAQIPRKRTQRKRGNGQGTVIKRGKTFTAIVTTGRYTTPDGKSHLIRVSQGGFRTKSEAVDYLPILKGGKPKTVTFQSLWNTYRAGAYNKLSSSKQTAYDIAAGRWKSIMAKGVEETTLEDLQTVLNAEAKTFYPARDMQSVLSHMYKIAMADKAATVNLARLLTLPELVEEEPEPFTEIELHKLWAAYGEGDRFLAFVLLMIYSGMMPGELLKMKKDMVNWETREICGCGMKTKKRKEAPIVFPAFLDPVLAELCECAGRTGKIVSMNKDNFYKEYHAAVLRAGVRDLPPYSCRHTTATALALGNIAPSIIQEVMRHSKLATTQRYIHMTNAEAHTAINTLTKGKEA